jgi:hypothetical protein
MIKVPPPQTAIEKSPRNISENIYIFSRKKNIFEKQ